MQQRRRQRGGTSCRVARSCGGCAWIERPYREQLRSKRKVLAAALGRERSLRGVEIPETMPSARQMEYRNRAKLAVHATDRGVDLGLYQRQTARVVDVSPCRVHRPTIQAALEPLRRWLREHRLAAPRGPVKYLDLREAQGGALHLTLISSEPPGEHEWPVDELVSRLRDRVVGICVNHQPEDSSYVFGRETVTLHGKDRFSAPAPDLPPNVASLQVPATGFFQVNAFQLGPIARRILAHLAPAPPGPMLDLYCGVGTWGLIVADDAGRDVVPQLMGVEEDPRAVECASLNAHTAGLRHRTRFRPGRVEQKLGRLVARQVPTRVVMNPGRPGCKPRALDALVQSPASRLAYLSCNPETLARDLAVLVDGGYAVERVFPVDMMPHTDQVEALALLRGEG